MEVDQVGDGSAPTAKVERKVYLPGKPLGKGEVLECDESVYFMRHECKAGERKLLVIITLYLFEVSSSSV